jgi:hypothetical protein
MTPAEFRAVRPALAAKWGRARVSQKELAAALRMGVHGWQTISKWERDDFDGEIPGPVSLAIEHLLHCPEAQA